MASLGFYGGVLGAGGLVFWFVRARGESLVAPPVAAPALSVAPTHPAALAHVLLSMAVIVLVARAVGSLFERWLRHLP